MFQLIIIRQNKVVLGQNLHLLNLSLCANKICRPTIVDNNFKKKFKNLSAYVHDISGIKPEWWHKSFYERVIIRLQDLL